MEILFNQPFYGKLETEYVSHALLDNEDYSEKSKWMLNAVYPESELFLTSSATYALELIISSLFFKKGAEVIMPSYNFPSAPNAVLRAGAMPVFADIDPHTLTLDLEDVKKKITRYTACIIPVHYGGVSCDMDALMALGRSKKIPIIEDAALSLGGRYKNKPLGMIGDYGVLSFDSTKNVSCEKGGLAMVNKAAPERIKTLTQFYNNGTDKQAFLEGEVTEYSWKQIGMNVAMSGLSLAVLAAQLEKYAEIQARRNAVYDLYAQALSEGQEKWGYQIPNVPEYNRNNAHVFYMVFDSEERRESVRKKLLAKEIHAHTHYAPLHLSSMGRYLGYEKGALPVTERITQCLLRLPLHAKMNENEAQCVIEAVFEALES